MVGLNDLQGIFQHKQFYDFNSGRGSSGVIAMLAGVKHRSPVKVASYNTQCWDPRVQALQRSLEEAAHVSPVHVQRMNSSYFCTGNGEGRRRRKKENKSCNLGSSPLISSGGKQSAFHALPSFVSAHL